MKLFEITTTIEDWSDEEWQNKTLNDVLPHIETYNGDQTSWIAMLAGWAGREDLEAELDKLATERGYKPPEDKREKVTISPGTSWYRGTRGPEGHSGEYGVNHREDYAVFVSDNPHQAATYAGPNGVITSLTLHPEVAYKFDSGRHHSFLQFDEQSRQLGKGQALVVTDLVDRGGYTDGVDIKLSTKPSTNVSFRDQEIAKITGKEPASKYFNT